MMNSHDYADRLAFLVLVVMAVIAAQGALHNGAVAQDLSAQELSDDPGERYTQRQPSAARRIAPISRTPEGLPLAARTSEIFDQIRARWGSDYKPLNVAWDRYWYPRAGRTVSGRFAQRRCGRAAPVPICEGTILRSATASMIEIVAFQDRVFRVSITLQEVPDYRIQSVNMMNALRQKYGPPSQGSRWYDGETELIFSELGPAWPATLQYTDTRGSENAERAARAFVEAESARLRARSLRTPRGY